MTTGCSAAWLRGCREEAAVSHTAVVMGPGARGRNRAEERRWNTGPRRPEIMGSAVTSPTEGADTARLAAETGGQASSASTSRSFQVVHLANVAPARQQGKQRRRALFLRRTTPMSSRNPNHLLCCVVVAFGLSSPWLKPPKEDEC